MKKTLLSSAILGLALLGQNASAAVLPYEDFIDVDKHDVQLSYGVAYNGNLDINADDGDNQARDKYGFQSNLYKVLNVAVAFSFYEIVESAKVWSVVTFDFLGAEGSNSGFGVGIPGDLSNSGFEFDFLFDSATLNDDIGMKLIADVQEDGILSWSISLLPPTGVVIPDGTASNIKLFASVMGVQAVPFAEDSARQPTSSPVPDSGSTFAALGAVILGLMGVRRRGR